jgi:hypothetical protein
MWNSKTSLCRLAAWPKNTNGEGIFCDISPAKTGGIQQHPFFIYLHTKINSYLSLNDIECLEDDSRLPRLDNQRVGPFQPFLSLVFPHLLLSKSRSWGSIPGSNFWWSNLVIPGRVKSRFCHGFGGQIEIFRWLKHVKTPRPFRSPTFSGESVPASSAKSRSNVGIEKGFEDGWIRKSRGWDSSKAIPRIPQMYLKWLVYTINIHQLWLVYDIALLTLWDLGM